MNFLPTAFQHSLVLAPRVRLSVTPVAELASRLSNLGRQLISDRNDVLPWICVEQPPAPHPCAKVGLSRNDELYVNCACGHQMMRRLHAWMVCKRSFYLTGDRRLSGMECVNESHECPLSLCRVTFLRTQHASFFQTIPQPTRCMSQVLQHVERHEDELDWNSTSV